MCLIWSVTTNTVPESLFLTQIKHKTKQFNQVSAGSDKIFHGFGSQSGDTSTLSFSDTTETEQLHDEVFDKNIRRLDWCAFSFFPSFTSYTCRTRNVQSS